VSLLSSSWTMKFSPEVCAASCICSIALTLSGCGGGGGSTTTTTQAPDLRCLAYQGQCSSCFNGDCLGCNDGYVKDHHNATEFPGGRCISTCIGQPPRPKPARPPTPTALNGVEWPAMCIDKSNANFFGIGDWGGDGAGAPGHTWTNPGRCDGESSRPCQDADHWAQKYVARQMKLVAKHAKPDYVVNVGDNFYPGGITSGCQSGSRKGYPGGINDSHPGKDPSGQWAHDFEAVYLDDPDLKGKPWLSVLGNHDYGGTGFHMGWDQQIFASWERDDWVMPSQFYFHKVQYRDFAVQYFFLESNFADTDVHDVHHCICQGSGSCWQMADVAGCVSDLHSAWTKSKRMVAKNWDATAEWHIVVTHFPPPTVFGDADIMKINSEKEGGIDLLINGHTHMQNCGKDESTGMTWILTGEVAAESLQMLRRQGLGTTTPMDL